MVVVQSDLRSVIQIAATVCYLNPSRFDSRPDRCAFVRTPPARLKQLCVTNAVVKTVEKPSICTADELHYVSVHNSDWRLALWRYKPPPKSFRPSVMNVNRLQSSFARSMSSQGFDTWILEVRGAGLSAEVRSSEVKQPVKVISGKINSSMMNKETDSSSESEISSAKGRTEMVTKSDVQSMKNFRETFEHLSERLSILLNEGLLEATKGSTLTSQFRDLSQRLVNIIDGQRSVSPQFSDLLQRFSTTIEDFQKQIDLIVKYNWDFDHYLEEDVPAAMDYVKGQCKPKDGKLLAIGHSMGGILLYATLSRNSCNGKNSKLASVITLGSSLDYSTSKSSLKSLLPLANPAQALSVPVVPLGALLAAVHPLASHPPYVMSWLKTLVSAQDMMHPELLEKLVMNNFWKNVYQPLRVEDMPLELQCTVPAKLLLQLKTALQKGGLCDRSGSFFYKVHLHKIDVPVLAIAGDQDLICPPEAVYETLKLIPEHLATFKVFGEPGGPHYAHYDLVGGRLAAYQVYPFITEFLSRHDQI
ncbi:hypothetical protein LguiB_007553 [Lonicera macranthoides]